MVQVTVTWLCRKGSGSYGTSSRILTLDGFLGVRATAAGELCLTALHWKGPVVEASLEE